MRLRRRLFAALAAFVAAASSPTPCAVAADEAGRPSRAERAAYWLDRLALGPEPTTFAVRSFYQSLLDDSIRGLCALPAETLDRLADPAYRARLQGQQDANPWHAILRVLSVVGKARPDVVRAWAAPAFDHRLLTLAREALPAVRELRSPEDGPLLARALRRFSADAVLGPGCAEALVLLGRPWDTEACRGVFPTAVVDAPYGRSSAWEAMAGLLGAAPGGADLSALAWWALLAETAGPRVKATAARGDAPASGGHLAPPAVPEDTFADGATAAARTRGALAKAGFAVFVAAARADAAGPDAELAAIARSALGQLPFGRDEMLRRAARAAEALSGTAAGGPLPDPEAVRVLVDLLAADADPACGQALERLLGVFPLAREWGPATYSTYDALVRRGAAPRALVARWLGSRDDLDVDRALLLLRHAADPAYLPLLEAWMDRPGLPASRRFEGRRIAAFVATQALSHGGLAPEEPARWARLLGEWARDPEDRSGSGFLGALVDLGPAGEARLAEGLLGPERAAYLAIVSSPIGRYLSPEIVSAVVGPVDASTPSDDRRAALEAVFAIAGSDSVPALEKLSRRLRREDRPDVEFIERIVEHRSTSTAPAGP